MENPKTTTATTTSHNMIAVDDNKNDDHGGNDDYDNTAIIWGRNSLNVAPAGDEDDIFENETTSTSTTAEVPVGGMFVPNNHHNTTTEVKRKKKNKRTKQNHRNSSSSSYQKLHVSCFQSSIQPPQPPALMIQQQKLEEMESLIQRERNERKDLEDMVKKLYAAQVVLQQQQQQQQQPDHLDQQVIVKKEQQQDDSNNTGLVDSFSASSSLSGQQQQQQQQQQPEKKKEDNHNQNQEQQQDDEECWHKPFGESVYTMLYLCEVKTQAFWYSIFVYGLQMFTISLTLADAIDYDNKNNPLQLPPMVRQAVTYAQGVTVIMLFSWQQDVIEAVIKLGDGFYDKLLLKEQEGEEEKGYFPGATYSKWLGSCLAQLGSGLLLLLSCFILTMQAPTVIDLMLNLTALMFISEIDDLGFYMAKIGFIKNTLRDQAESVLEVKFPKTRGRRTFYRRILYFLTMACLFVGYFIIKGKQLTGYYLSTNIYVQFGDAYNPTIPYYSGILSATTKTRWTGSHRQYRDIETSNILLAYCGAEHAWTFSEQKQKQQQQGEGTTINTNHDDDNNDPCNNYFAKSYETKTYDVTSIPDSEWQVLDSNGRLQPFESFSLVERDCNPDTCRGNCGRDDGLCHCQPDQFGLDCEFHDLCEEIIIDERFSSFPQVYLGPSSSQATNPEDKKLKLEDQSFSKRFRLLKNDNTDEFVHIYSMPVYYSNSTFPANVMFFGGRRWILATERDLINLTQAKEENPTSWFFPEKTVAALENDFHAHYKANYTPFFVSDPVDFETPDFQPTPIGVHWWTVKNEGGGDDEEDDELLRLFTPDAPVDAILICHVSPPSCVDQPESYCGSHGVCNNSTGKCNCRDTGFYYGDRCDLVKPCYDHTYPCNFVGTCDQVSGICSCPPPYHGDACLSKHQCFEEEGRCKSGGVCNDVTGGCACPADPSISGKACELRADCSYFGCSNGGVCGWNGQCVCRPPYYGSQCDLVDRTQKQFFCSEDKDCMNGTCNLDTGFCNCTNPSSYGPLCEHNFNCSQTPKDYSNRISPCFNSGTCNNITGLCECPENYFGPDCYQVSPCLSDEDCGPEGAHWSRCHVESGTCQCYNGKLSGLLCEGDAHLRRCRSHEDCFGRGTCFEGVCQCKNGRGGNLCESYIVGEYLPYRDTNQNMLEESVQLCGFEDPLCCSSDDKGYPEELKYLCYV